MTDKGIEEERKERGLIGRRVLIVDDDVVAREFMGDLLRNAGLVVFNLGSPIGASRRLIRDNIDVVVIDVLMPALRGDRLAKLLRGNTKFDKLGVVLVSGDVTIRLQELAAEVGAVAVVEKSKVRQELVAAISSALQISPYYSLRPKREKLPTG